jgi:hypothetical protein
MNYFPMLRCPDHPPRHRHAGPICQPPRFLRSACARFAAPRSHSSDGVAIDPRTVARVNGVLASAVISVGAIDPRNHSSRRGYMGGPSCRVCSQPSSARLVPNRSRCRAPSLWKFFSGKLPSAPPYRPCHTDNQ